MAWTMLLTSCSWVLTDKLPSDYSPKQMSEPRCDTGRGPMIADLVFAGVSGVSSAVELSSSEQNVKNAGFVDLAFGLVFAISAATGASWTGQCRAAIAEYDSRPHTPPTNDAGELQRLRAEKAARDAAELERLRADYNALTDAGVSVDAAVP